MEELFSVVWLSWTINQPIRQCFASKYKINGKLRHVKIFSSYFWTSTDLNPLVFHFDIWHPIWCPWQILDFVKGFEFADKIVKNFQKFFSCLSFFNWRFWKRTIILALGRGILADFWVTYEIESCNFQNLLAFGFPETPQNLISFRQLLFSLFQRGDPEICQNDPVLGPRWSGPFPNILLI